MSNRYPDMTAIWASKDDSERLGALAEAEGRKKHQLLKLALERYAAIHQYTFRRVGGKLVAKRTE